MCRYEPVPVQVESVVDNVKENNFPNLMGANIMSIFDTKKKVQSGKISVARIKKTNDELKFFAMNNDGVTYDYMLFIDKAVFEVLSDRDKERVIYHELCHCDVNFDKKCQYGIKDHEIQGFYDEVDYNSDDSRWSERVADVADSVYDTEE
jgi:predicted metallopeptidase